MDGASALNARMSQAYTATKWQRDTRRIKERLFNMSLGDERREIGWFGDPLYTPVWGGIVPRASSGAMLGALVKAAARTRKTRRSARSGRRSFRACERADAAHPI